MGHKVCRASDITGEAPKRGASPRQRATCLRNGSPLDGAADGGAGDAEEFGELAAGVLASGVEGQEVALLGEGEVGLLAA